MIKGSHHTKEAKRKMSEAIAGENHPNYGKHMSEETKKKSSESHKGYKPSKETKEKLSKANRRENHINWKGGFIKNTEGYLLFNVPDECRFSCMKGILGYIPVHRLIMAAYLQRPLTKKEVVHHVDGNLDNNKIENLMLFENTAEHTRLHWDMRRCN